MGQKGGGRAVVSILPTFNEAKVAKGGQQNSFVWQMKTGVRLSALSMKKRNLLMLVVAKECIYICPIQKDLDLSPVEDVAEVISVVCYKELLGWIILWDSRCYLHFFICWLQEVTERYLTSDEQMPLKKLRKHVYNCSSTLCRLLVWWKLTNTMFGYYVILFGI